MNGERRVITAQKNGNKNINENGRGIPSREISRRGLRSLGGNEDSRSFHGEVTRAYFGPDSTVRGGLP